MSDELQFLPENEESIAKQKDSDPWKIMIVDDDKSVHEVTKLALRSVEFSGRPLHFIDAYSGEEAKIALKEHPDTALVLLDVVMENDHAGLDAAKHIREVLANKNIRIVLRTGQPGQAPEKEVITSFDINDYKEKTELTSSKLFTVVYSSLRAYRDIVAIEAGKRGLAQVIEASSNIFQLAGVSEFSKGVLEQLTALVSGKSSAVMLKNITPVNGLAITYGKQGWNIIVGIGEYENSPPDFINQKISKEKAALLAKVLDEKKSCLINNTFAAYFEDRDGNKNVLLLDNIDSIDSVENDLIQLFIKNVSIAFENVHLHSDLEETQREIVCLLGESVERRSKETGNHVRRVAAISELLALESGLSAEEAQILKYASPLHDLGKIAIPDEILNKPGIHTPEETMIMREHAEIGYKMLVSSKRIILRAAAIVAHEHHERWDGNGYPQGKSGEDIHLYGRITAVADVFDALSNDRCYKKAWPHEDVIKFFEKERGKQFDPNLVDLLLKNMEKISLIQKQYKDSFASNER